MCDYYCWFSLDVKRNDSSLTPMPISSLDLHCSTQSMWWKHFTIRCVCLFTDCTFQLVVVILIDEQTTKRNDLCWRITNEMKASILRWPFSSILPMWICVYSIILNQFHEIIQLQVDLKSLSFGDAHIDKLP